MNMSKFSTRGFTLIEVMITVAIVAILAAVAVPSYNRYVLKSGRTEAFAAMAAVQQAQERWRANKPAYTANLSDLGIAGTTSPSGYYNLAFTSGTVTSTGYTLTATAAAGKRQTGDTGCTTLTLVVSNGNGAPPAANASCWSR
jgi:type IV pilus assembly protein PilE